MRYSLLVLCFVLATFNSVASAQTLSPQNKNFSQYQPGPAPLKPGDHVPGRVLIKMASAQEGQALQQHDTRRSALGLGKMERLFPHAQAPSGWQRLMASLGKARPAPDLTTWYHASLPKDADVAPTIQKLRQEPDIVWAEPDYIRRPLGLPAGQEATPQGAVASDSASDQQWHLAAARVPEAWDYLTSQGKPAGGSRDIMVAVIDTGVDYTHPDLAANMWVNGGEIAGNGQDDDGNGYVDDIHGVNVVANSGDPMDDQGHGTHVAGIIAALANGTGVEGVAYNVRIMAVKVSQPNGAMAVSDIAKGIQYAVAMGADIINMSFGSYTRSQAEEDALTMASAQAVLVAGAGNDGKVDLPGPGGADMYPAAYSWVLGVMASDQSGVRTSWSNYDYQPGDLDEYELMAPGVNIWSTLPGQQYAGWSGTSMSAAVVSGVAALVRTQFDDRGTYSPGFIMGQIAKTAPAGLDAYAAVTTPPQPDLAYQKNYVFDPQTLSSVNSNDGIVNAGETIDLGIVLRNHWGQAGQVAVKLEAIADDATQPDPYVTMLIDTVSYGSINSFAWKDNGLIKDGSGAVTGVQNPFRFLVSTATPDNYQIPFKLTITAINSLDPVDTTTHTYTSRFTVPVQRGRVLPSVISQDMTLTKDYLWIVAGPTTIQSGVTLTINPGTQVQWSTGNSELSVGGNLNAQGTYDAPIYLKASGSRVTIGGNNNSAATIVLKYTIINNLYLSGYGISSTLTIDHAHIYEYPAMSTSTFFEGNLCFTNSIFSKIIDSYIYVGTMSLSCCLFDNCGSNLNNIYYVSPSNNNSILISNNTLKSSSSAETTYPFVVNCVTSNKYGQPTDQVGAETATFTITYNRDMDTTVQPTVTFGPDGSDYTAHIVTGGWQDVRTWVGTFDVTPLAGDGYQYLRIIGGRAASDPWLVCGDDAGRFRFQIVTTGTVAMNIQAAVSGSSVELSWTQNDFTTLAGYYLYRANSPGGPFTRLNSAIIPRGVTLYVDTNVQPGQTYYYQFTVVTTSYTESPPSKVAQATIPDTLPPVISHTPVATATAGQSLSISANVTDNVAVQSVTLHFRQTGTATYTNRSMINVTGSKYTAAIEASQVTAAGLDYYLTASDGVNSASAANAAYPYQVFPGGPAGIYITASAGGNGSITPAGAVAVNSGGSQTFTITPDTGYHVASIVVDGTPVGAVSSYTFYGVTGNHTIAASFAINTYTITAGAGPGGYISPVMAVQVDHGGSRSFAIRPDHNYNIESVVVDGVSVGPVPSYSFTAVSANHSITASFVPTPGAILTDKDSLIVPAGRTAPLQVKLSEAPSANVAVTAAWLSGSPALSIRGAATLTFTPANWNNYQTVLLAATPGKNDVNASAVFQLSASGETGKQVTAVKGETGINIGSIFILLLDN